MMPTTPRNQKSDRTTRVARLACLAGSIFLLAMTPAQAQISGLPALPVPALPVPALPVPALPDPNEAVGTVQAEANSKVAQAGAAGDMLIDQIPDEAPVNTTVSADVSAAGASAHADTKEASGFLAKAKSTAKAAWSGIRGLF